MNTTKYALESTEREVADAYRNLDRLLSSNQTAYAITAATRLAKQDSVKLWNYLREYSSLLVSCLDNDPLLVVNALSNNWDRDHSEVFVVRAVLALVQATKGGNTAADAMKKYL